MASLRRGCMAMRRPLEQVLSSEHVPGPAQDGVFGGILGRLQGQDLQNSMNRALVGVSTCYTISAMYWLAGTMPSSSQLRNC